MNIEETTENLKKYISFSKKECNFPSTWDWNWHIDLANDVQTLLTAYEKEKETSHYIQSQLDIANAKLVEEKEKNKELSEQADNLLGEKEYYQDCYDGITFKINNLISQIESAIDFMKTDKSKIKVDMYQQKEEDLKLEIVHLKKLLEEE